MADCGWRCCRLLGRLQGIIIIVTPNPPPLKKIHSSTSNEGGTRESQARAWVSKSEIDNGMYKNLAHEKCGVHHPKRSSRATRRSPTFATDLHPRSPVLQVAAEATAKEAVIVPDGVASFDNVQDPSIELLRSQSNVHRRLPGKKFGGGTIVRTNGAVRSSSGPL